MNVRRAALLTAAVLGAVALWFYFGRTGTRAGLAARPRAGVTVSAPVAQAPPAIPPPVVAAGSGEAPSRIAEQLNAPQGSARRDLEIVSDLFAAWQSNFPGQGNPVGENAEITAALAGANALKFAFIAPNHPAINQDGQLCDRWGTPYRFHQVSGTHMEIRSAGPDGKFATADDLAWPPP